jgi:hypothetical protein
MSKVFKVFIHAEMLSKDIFHAARDGDLTIVQQLVREGSVSSQKRDFLGNSALLIAISNAQFPVAQWLLEHGGSSITERSNYCRGSTTWDYLRRHIRVDADGIFAGDSLFIYPIGDCPDAAALMSLLRVMVLREDPPASLVAELTPEHARVVEKGARLRARLPAYLAQ